MGVIAAVLVAIIAGHLLGLSSWAFVARPAASIIENGGGDLPRLFAMLALVIAIMLTVVPVGRRCGVRGLQLIPIAWLAFFMAMGAMELSAHADFLAAPDSPKLGFWEWFWGSGDDVISTYSRRRGSSELPLGWIRAIFALVGLGSIVKLVIEED
ncbi:MAG: hypothetical protein Fur0042_30410 [Cyanophyceae cyanobacterium]